METITMTGFNQQKRIDALKEALGYLQKVHNIIEKQDIEHSKQEMPHYYENWFQAEAKVSSVICHVSDAIGALVAEDIANIYLVETELSDK